MTQLDDDHIFANTCTQLADYNKTGVKLTRATRIVADLEVDSVDVLDFIMAVEDQYDISLPMEMVSEIHTIGDLVDKIKRLQGN